MAARTGPFRAPGWACGRPCTARRRRARAGRALYGPGAGRPVHRSRGRSGAAHRRTGRPARGFLHIHRYLDPNDGRGLLLVAALADKRGVGERKPGEVVWCEFAVRGRGPCPAADAPASGPTPLFRERAKGWS
ncbi:hypothetical protein [Streptomyces sp. NPDC052042]|uniref:hypothetical protein n=1 Tax=Streptomyces sp. NPDC052042 TaxID=3365683 RepID=UPI0037D02B20